MTMDPRFLRSLLRSRRALRASDKKVRKHRPFNPDNFMAAHPLKFAVNWEAANARPPETSAELSPLEVLTISQAAELAGLLKRSSRAAAAGEE